MDEKQPEASKILATSWQPSEELQRLLSALTETQSRGIERIVEAELDHRSIESLLHGPNKICNHSTYYRPKRGWVFNEKFKAALSQARKEIRAARLKSAVDDAIEELKLATPAAARDLRRQVSGDESAIMALAECARNTHLDTESRTAAIAGLGQIGTARATEVLIELLNEKDNEAVRVELLAAIGRSGAGLDAQRRMADIAVLDRADKQTADKGNESENDLEEIGRRRWEQIAPLLAQIREEAHGAAFNAPAPISY